VKRTCFPYKIENILIFLIFLKNINALKIHHIARIQMTRKKTVPEISTATGGPCGCNPVTGCKLESVLSVDDRGQMVLPKEVRERAGISSGDKLALISWERDGRVCCLALMKVENLSGMVKGVLGPLMYDTEH
jgi:AbrB family looped-hinge helix DNA binding protein